MSKSILLVLLSLSAGLLPAQTIWREISENTLPQTQERRIVPQRYRTVQLDAGALKTLLLAAPERFATANRTGREPILELPMPNGGSARFRLVESPVMAPALQARYPDIRSYTGYGIDDPSALLKCDWTPGGFHGMLQSNRWGEVYIDPYAQGDVDHYVVYNKKDYSPAAKKQRFSCGLETTDAPENPEPAKKVSERSNDGNMRRYRLALACTGEYATFHGGTKPLVLAAMVTSINRVNGVYEREFAVTMQLVPNNDTLIYLDGLTDPYSNNNGDQMLGQNKTACNNRIGSANYDIGHVFSTGGGGIAGLGVVCTGDKARGVTGQEAPVGDAFDIDFVAHEMGHQFSGNHTQNNDCSRNDITAVEPGSASTIMGYAGICPPDVQQHSDDYFHGINVEEINNYILNSNGNTCPVLIPNGNTPPLVSAGPDYVIPISTPFVLTAQGSDPDDNAALTYCWEQMDYQAAAMPPSANAKVGPLFRSFQPDTLPYRYFPERTVTVGNINSYWEKLPGVGRKMNFRVTARDNNPTGGNTAQDDMTVTADATSGPFRVTSPNTATTWHSGEYRIVTWDVANTNKTPVNCQTVNILLSTDGGFTYPLVLAAGIPNNGKYCLQAPELTTQTARISIAAADNIFFDISNANFSIEPATAPAFSLCASELSAQVCLPQAYTTTVSTSALLGFGTPVELSAAGLPPGATATFNPNPVMPGASAELQIVFPTGLTGGPTDLSVTGIAGADTQTVHSTLTLVPNDYSNIALVAPANGATGLTQVPVLHWQGVPDADQYDLEIATNPSFDPANLTFGYLNIKTDSLKSPLILEKGTVYYWHVRPVNECGPGDWVGPFAFSTLVNTCLVKAATDIPKNITGSQVVTVESKINIPANSTVSDVNVTQIAGYHEFFKDLEMHLISPAGTDVPLFAGKCGGFNGNFNFGFDDSGLSEMTCPPPSTGTIFRPYNGNLLSAFNGENAGGDWTLRVKDNVISSGGAITAFELELCASTILHPPVLVNNLPLQISAGTNKAITVDLLKAEDVDNTDNELVYTLMTTPKHGQLQVFWTGELLPGAPFTQADLNNGGLRYFDYGNSPEPDAFCFTVTDGTGGMTQGCFTIMPFGVAATEPGTALEFVLAPNPASGSVRIRFGEPLVSDARIRVFDAAGRLQRSAVLAAGQAGYELGLEGLPQGLYMVALSNARGYGVRKLFVR